MEVDKEELGCELKDKGVQVSTLVAQLGTAVEPLEQAGGELGPGREKGVN